MYINAKSLLYFKAHIETLLLLTRAPVAVSANFAILGGGICNHPLATKNPIGLETHGKKHSIALNRYLKKYFGHFSSQSNISVTTRSPKGQNPIDVIIFFRKRAVASGTVIIK